MSEKELSRLDTELELLEAMYPEQIQYNAKSHEVKFSGDSYASLLLRLPDAYPEAGDPDVISAIDRSKNDVRAQTKAAVLELELPTGEEALDAIIAAFQQVLESNASSHQQNGATSTSDKQSQVIPNAKHASDVPKTVIIWLHHLLNTNKRKLALSPSTLSGITKPGYPGVLIYSGPVQAVTEHVTLLKAQNWQAFNVRYEEEEAWMFAHGQGVREVETMAEVAKGVDCAGAEGKVGEKGRRQKEDFLKAVGIK